MATETRYLYNDEDLTAHSNQVKELVLESLVSQGVITAHQCEEYLTRYTVVIAKKGWLGATIDKALGLDGKTKKLIVLDRGA